MDEHYGKKIFNMLIDAGASVNWQDNEGWTMLHVAAESGLLDACTTLLEAGVDIFMQNEDGETAFTRALDNEYPKLMALFMKHGAKLDV